MVTFSFTGFSGLEEFLVASGKDGPFFTGEFVSWGDVADRGVKAHGVLEHLSRPQERWPARPWKPKPSLKGSGFVQPLAPHEHWHVDVSYINISGTFFYLCSLLDGCSRSIVHGELREAMTEDASRSSCSAARRYPHAKPRIISDNGPQFIARDFKEFIRIAGLTHVRTSPYYPQSNEKIERWHKSLKADCIRPGVPLSFQDARRLVSGFVEHYQGSPPRCRDQAS